MDLHNVTNTTLDDHHHDEEEEEGAEVLHIILLALWIILGVCGNLLVLVTIIKSSKINLQSQGMVLNLAVADILFLVTVIPFGIVGIFNHNAWILGDALCKFTGFLCNVFIHSSVANLLLIACTRYFSIVHISAFRNHFTKKNIMIMMAATWGTALLMSLLPFTGWGTYGFEKTLHICNINWTHSASFNIFSYLTLFVIPVCLMVYFYMRILHAVIMSKKRVTVSVGDKGSMADAKARKENIRLALQLLSIFFWFIICLCPYLTLMVFIDPNGNVDHVVHDVIASLYLMNSAINPVIYFFFNKTLRKEAANILCWWKESNPQLISVTESTDS